MSASHQPLQGRTAVVTGAGNGIGRAIAIKFGQLGAKVVLTGRDEAKLVSVAAELSDEVRVETVDTTSEESVTALAECLDNEDVSILVNNAGIAGPVAPMTDVSTADWDAVFDVNVKGVFLMCRAFLPSMLAQQRGDIINIASVSGKRPLARRTPYTASKMAVIGLTTTLAHEVGPSGVNVNTLSPGPVAGPRMDRNFALEAERSSVSVADAEAEFVSRSAIRRMVTESEVAGAAAAMLSMGGLCGADIDLSGGMVAR